MINIQQNISRANSESYRSFIPKAGEIKKGDKIIFKLMRGYREEMQASVDNVSDITELIGTVRTMARGRRGLVTLWIWNQTRGWSQRRPIMLYNDLAPSDFRRLVTGGDERDLLPESPRKMLFPWETH